MHTNAALACDSETERLQALYSLKLLDSPASEAFDAVTRLVAHSLCFPIVLVSLLDADRQWFKSRVGLEASETPRHIAFCWHAVAQRQPLIVSDALRDARFAENPLVTGVPQIRAYIGIPLFTRGQHAIGTLCGIDRVCREFDAKDIAVMSDYARVLEEFIHGRELAAKTADVLQYALERERSSKRAEAELLLVRDSLTEQVAAQTEKLETINVALLESNAKLAADNATDFLTGLPNRRVFSRRADEAAAAHGRYGTRCGLVLLDLDDFKQVNDFHGHDSGDEVLRALGRILLGEVRDATDVAARLGGEEFAVLCFGDLDELGLCEFAERIRARINQERVVTPKGELRFTASFGLALTRAGDTEWKSLYGRADAALYEAKAAGKDRVAFGESYCSGSSARVRALRA
jgi:diguanylate cyclase (GGDEF)-like protein